MVNAKFLQRDRRCESMQNQSPLSPGLGSHQAKIYERKINRNLREFSTN